MKKIIISFLSLFLLVGCNSTDQQESKKELKENEVNTEEEAQRQLEEKITEFMIDSYEKADPNEFRHVDTLLSEKLTERMNLINNEEIENIASNTIKKFELYTTESNENRYLYYVILEVDEVTTDHYGEIITVNENGEKKIDTLKEIQVSER